MLKQSLNQKLLQKLSPQQIQFVQLLQLTTTEISNKVDEELAENAALESGKEDEDNDPKQEDIDLGLESSSDNESEELPTQDFETDITEYLGDEDNYQNYTPDYSTEERKEIPIASYKTLYDTLTEQLNPLDLTEREEILAKHLIGMIEEDGYLRRPLKSISYDLAFLNSVQTDEEELEKALLIIQNLEPIGIAARNLQECLLLQLEAKEDQNEDVKIAIRVVKNYLNELANKHYEKLIKHLDIDKEKLRKVIEVITKLNPKPGESQVNFKTQYIIPDFTITQMSDGEFEISLNSHNAPQLHINKGFHEKLQAFNVQKKKTKKMREELQFIKSKLDNAKWFIEAIKQRQQTLLMTMSTIVELQKEFFNSGDFTKLRPMILKDIADRISMDISTVSRVVSSKYTQTDFGIFSLREFFSEGIMKDDGNEVSNREVKRILSDLIEAESKKRPLTDEKLTTLLNDKGYNIARRTVAKYREQMNIPVARLRKEL
ncbi:MAG: RNA polymerase factor sigma-54 [Bacteroidetes bacterium]|nr:RNA polymerase factor sigma-54 [Bacteroidota bacterium]MBT5529734.1 RNA polymerase factor sigma-54 [Cytophagia bacterium]MBT3933837.1 RNA polymerase factor sigma-54 [Bacteroidota bacterium]MBT4337943.1 RNA polymerase factor sigma-54 [Bacteroidota bacterium]MBT4730087.1 RNA polymerase factor sigma-54 [Bacteroidota bacterium]